MLVEDEDNDAILVKRIFAKRGLQNGIHRVKDGEEAISYFSGIGEYGDRARFPIPTLTLLDLKMPRKNGFEVLKWVRNNPDTRVAPIIVFTSSQEKTDIAHAYEIGANAYFMKPSSLDGLTELLGTIQRHWLDLCLTPGLHA